MFQPLYVAASGLSAYEEQLLNITNNLANAKTVGFKRGDTEMENLLYIQKTFQDELDSAMENTQESPVIPEFGTGVKIASTPKDFTQGAIETTSNQLDFAIQGEGFFRIKLPDGSMAYSRAGNFHADNEGNLVTSNGQYLDPPIVLPQGTTSVSVSQNGTVSVSINNSTDLTEVGQLTIARFPNPSGLKGLGQNLFGATDSSGDPIVGDPADEGFGSIAQFSLESSNVDVISEMMKMVMVQRVFDTITKAVSSYEGMLASLEKMKA